MLDCEVVEHIILKSKDIIILAVKPQIADQLLVMLKGSLDSTNLVISIMAGISLEQISGEVYPAKVIRVMPNTPCQIGAGMSVYCGDNHIPYEDFKFTETILNSMGESLRVKNESLINSAIAISGSGPAYLFCLAESLVLGAQSLGFNEDQANLLVSQTLLGSSKLLSLKEKSAQQLRFEVTSPGGTTEAALAVFESNHVKDILLKGFKTAFERAVELGKNT